MISLALDDREWSRFVFACPEATPFHHPAWSSLLANSYGYDAFALVMVDRHGAVTAGLPVVEVKVPMLGRRWVSLPFTDVCPPLLSAGTSPEQLLTELETLRSAAGVRELELRADLGAPGTHSRQSGVIHRLRLGDDPDAVFSRFTRARLPGDIRKARRHGVEIRHGVSRADVTDVFYDLHVNTRRRQGVPVQPRRYFSLLWEHLVQRGLGFVAVAHSGHRPVAAAVFLTWNGTVVYKYGASDPDDWRLRPNHLLFAEVIRWACTNGYHTLDFGRTEVANDGLRAFKSGWGAVEEPLTYSVVGNRSRGGASARVSTVLSPVIRRSPPWVSRVLGELFYRYAA